MSVDRPAIASAPQAHEAPARALDAGSETSGVSIILRPPKVGPVLGYQRATRDGSRITGFSQRVFFTIETNFLDAPSRGLVAVREIGTDTWDIFHGLHSVDGIDGQYRQELCASQAQAPSDPLVTYFTMDVPLGPDGRWELLCLSLSTTLPGSPESGLDDDTIAFEPRQLAARLNAIAKDALDPAKLLAMPDIRHGYVNRRLYRKAVLDLSQSSAGADRAAFTTSGSYAASASSTAGTAVTAGADAFTFAVGSCRYPGTELDRLRCDRLLNSITAKQPAFTLLLGDAIYADAAVDVATQRAEQERWVNRYEHAFVSPGFAALLAACPTYFLPDDHEFSNDWAALPDLGRRPLKAHEQLARSRQDTFAWAFDAFTVFEWWHGPRAGAQSAPRTSRGRAVLARAAAECPPQWPATFNWSTTRFGGQPFFLMDTRTERTRGWTGDRDRLVSAAQMRALIDWLVEHQRHPGHKFVVSAAPIAPAPKAVIDDADAGLFDDGWWGFPEQMREVLAVIAHHRIEHVMFIGGDSHLGASGRLSLGFARGKDAHQGDSNVGAGPIEVAWVVSSGLFIPLPGVNGRPTDYPPDEHSLGGRPNPMCYSPANGPVNSAYSAIDGGQLTCELRIQCFHFREHAVTIKVPKSAPGATSLPWPQVDFLL